MEVFINGDVWLVTEPDETFIVLDKIAEVWRQGDSYEVVAALEIAMHMLLSTPTDDTAERIFDEMAIVAECMLMSAKVTASTRPRLEQIRNTSRMYAGDHAGNAGVGASDERSAGDAGEKPVNGQDR